MNRVIPFLIAVSLFGCAGGQASGGGGGGGPEQDHGAYSGTVYGCVMSFFTPPAGDLKGLAVHVEMKINPDGAMQEPVVIKPSENPEYDEAILTAARSCRTLPPPPASIATKMQTEGLKMAFKK